MESQRSKKEFEVFKNQMADLKKWREESPVSMKGDITERMLQAVYEFLGIVPKRGNNSPVQR